MTIIVTVHVQKCDVKISVFPGVTSNPSKRAVAWKLPEHTDWYQGTHQLTTLKKVEEHFLSPRSSPGIITADLFLLIRFDLYFPNILF